MSINKNEFSSTSKINEGCIVHNSILKDYSRLKNNVEFRESILGEYSYVSSFSLVNHTEIEKFTSIGPGCFIGLWEHDTEVTTHSFYLYETSGGFVKGYRNYKKDHVKTFIGNDVWIGANVSIKKGVKIGNGAIIGSSAVVTKDVSPYSIIVGNPGKVLKFRYNPDEIKILENYKWWDMHRNKIQEMVDLNLFDNFQDFMRFINKQNI